MYSTLIITIIIVLLLLLFIYNMINVAPVTNSNPSGKPSTNVNENSLTPSNNIIPVTPSTMTTTFTPIIVIDVPATLTLVLSNSSTLTNTTSISYSTLQSGAVALSGGFSQSTTSVGNIQYDGSNYLYFYGLDIAAENPPKMTLNVSLIGLTVTDTSSPTIMYDISTASATGNTLTLTSGSNTLTIIFPNTFQ